MCSIIVVLTENEMQKRLDGYAPSFKPAVEEWHLVVCVQIPSFMFTDCFFEKLLYLHYISCMFTGSPLKIFLNVLYKLKVNKMTFYNILKMSLDCPHPELMTLA